MDIGIEKLIKPFRVNDGRRFRLKDIDPGDTLGLQMKKPEAKRALQGLTLEVSGIQGLSDALKTTS